MAAVTPVVTKATRDGEVAKALGMDYDLLRNWRRAAEREGVEGLVPDRRGPKTPSKLSEELIERIRPAPAEGKILRGAVVT
ncbi:MAG: helix-turn-helix domain-containing protein [Acidimicrobiales bacterium]